MRRFALLALLGCTQADAAAPSFSTSGTAWTATGGTLLVLNDSQVRYTAGPTPGSYNVTADSSGVSGSAAITIAAASVAGCPATSGRVVAVSTASQILTATANAQPGDQIQLAAGNYAVRPNITASGTATNPITLCGPRSAILNTGYDIFRTSGSWWAFQNFTVTGGAVGIVVQDGDYNVLDSLDVSGMGSEGIELKGTAKHNTVTNNDLHDLGQGAAPYGEGVYVGNGSTHADPADSNLIANNRIWRATGECIQVHTGTRGNIVRGNLCDAGGTVYTGGQSTSVFADGGNGTVIEGNTVFNVPAGRGLHGFLELNAVGSILHGNSVTGGYDRGYFVTGGSGVVLGCDNTATGGNAWSNGYPCTQ